MWDDGKESQGCIVYKARKMDNKRENTRGHRVNNMSGQHVKSADWLIHHSAPPTRKKIPTQGDGGECIVINAMRCSENIGKFPPIAQSNCAVHCSVTLLSY